MSILHEPLVDGLLGRPAAQDALPAGVVGAVEALEQPLEVVVAGHRDAQHLALDPAVEALRHPVRARRVGPGLAVLDAEPSAGPLETLGREARAAVGDHEGEVVQREAGGATQRADHGALLLACLPGPLWRAAGAVPALGQPALAPLADGFGGDAVALGQDAGALARAGDLGAHGWGGAGVRVDRKHQATPPAGRVRSSPSKRQAYVATAQRA